MPQVIVIDEIGTELEAQAARTIAERGVQLIGTAHGNNLDNLMLNPTLSDLIGGIQSVTLGDDEARRRRSQKSVLERKAPPTFDVIVEIQDREKVLVHADVAATVDAMLLGDPVSAGAPLAGRGGRAPLPVAAEAVRARGRRGRATGSAGSPGPGPGRGGASPGWRGASHVPHGRLRGRGPAAGAPGVPARAVRRLAQRRAAGSDRGGSDRGGSDRGGAQPGGRPTGPAERAAGRAVRRPSRGRTPVPGPRRVAVPGCDGGAGRAVRGRATSRTAARWSEPRPPASAAEVRARDARELQRQKAWRDEAARALNTLREDEGTRPVNAAELEADGGGSGSRAWCRARTAGRRARPGRCRSTRRRRRRRGRRRRRSAPARSQVEGGTLPTLRVFPHGISRKRLEQAIRDLQLPVIIARAAGRGRRGDDAPQRVPPEASRDPRGGGPRRSRSTSSRPTRSSRCRRR